MFRWQLRRLQAEFSSATQPSQAVSAGKADPAGRIVSTWPPKGESARFPVSRDVWISSVGKESVGNNGGASRLKLKGVQEYTLFDADLATLKGKLWACDLGDSRAVGRGAGGRLCGLKCRGERRDERDKEWQCAPHGVLLSFCVPGLRVANRRADA
jgi:hypothetical protein